MRANRTALLKADKKQKSKSFPGKFQKKQSEANCVFAKNDFPECDIAPDRLAFLAKNRTRIDVAAYLIFCFRQKETL